MGPDLERGQKNIWAPFWPVCQALREAGWQAAGPALTVGQGETRANSWTQKLSLAFRSPV